MFPALELGRIDARGLRFSPPARRHRVAERAGGGGGGRRGGHLAGRLPGGGRSLPAAAARGLGRARATVRWSWRASRCRLAELRGKRIGHPGHGHHRLAGAAADAGRSDPRGGADRPVQPGVRRPGRGPHRRRPADPRGPPAVPGAGLRPGRRAGRVVAGRDRTAAAAGGERHPAGAGSGPAGAGVAASCATPSAGRWTTGTS